MFILEKLDFLIDYLLKENTKILIDELPKNKEDKINLWRSLCNIREAKPISQEYLKKEKKFLQEELKNRFYSKCCKFSRFRLFYTLP